MSGTKTGTPGFVNPVDGKVYTVDPGLPGDPTVNPVASSADPGNMSVDNNVKDINKKTIITMGTYLSKLSKGKIEPSKVPNKYSIDESTDSTNLSSISSPEGYPSPLVPSDNSEQFNNGLPSSFSSDYPSISSNIKKGKSPASLPDGNQLLPTAVEKLPGTDILTLSYPIKEYTDKAIQPNRWTFKEGFATNQDILQPEKDFNVPLQSATNVLSAAKPSSEVLDSAEYKFDLRKLIKKSAEVTEKNYYPIDELPARSLSLTEAATGYPTPFSQEVISKQYTSRDEIKPISTDASLQGILIKGKQTKSSAGATDGNHLLNDYPGSFSISDENNKKYISSKTFNVAEETNADEAKNKLSDYTGNRGSKLLEIGNTRWATSDRRGSGIRFKKTKTNGGSKNPDFKLSDGTIVSAVKMSQVGVALSQRASGEIPGWKFDPSTGGTYNPSGDEAELKAILPSVNQLGILKIDNVLLQARDALDSIALSADEEAKIENSFSESSYFGEGGQSWGALTNVSEPYDDPSSIGLGITMIGLVVAIDLLYAAIGVLITGESLYVNRNVKGQLTLGSYRFKEPSKSLFSSLFPDPYEIFGIKPIESGNSFGECLRTGAFSFFLGSDKSDISLTTLAAGAAGIALDSLLGQGGAVGANLVVCRTIIRSGLILVETIKKISKTPTVTAGIKGSLGVLKLIRSSKLISAVNVFSSLGDSLLNRDRAANGFIKVTKVGPDGKPVLRNYYETVSTDIPNSSFTKHRLVSNGELILERAWATKRAPVMYLVPSSINNLRLEKGVKEGSFAGVNSLNPINTADLNNEIFRSSNITNANRLPSEFVDGFEKKLDSEYVPFSFQDVRTNEMISFHAFLASLTDDYAASYDSSEAFGRVEPIRIYKGTQRKISMSFYIASTSEDDFEHMWAKINKLTTLVYPQYTRGRTLTATNGYQFQAPFSQLIGASPLVRIRLGNLFRSNYSRFAIARLFGINDDAKLTASATPPPPSPSLEEQKKKIQDFIAGVDLPEGTLVESNELIRTHLKKFLYDPKRDKKPTSSLSDSLVRDFNAIDNDKFDLKIFLKSDNGNYGIRWQDISIYVPQSSVKPTQSAIDEYRKKLIEQSKPAAPPAPQPESTVQNVDTIANFLDSDKNAIIKSFESSGGKGLAGFIETMNFDWFDKVTWDTTKGAGRVAPKLCKVTISFSPIHDITPGLDHKGYNRAPIYPVGVMSPERK